MDAEGVEVVAVLCVGETMAVFTPAEAGPAEEVRTWVRGTGGAESNVACALAELGVPVGWVSAVGDDPFGRAVVASVAAAGVDVSHVLVDPVRPTGLYVKEAGKAGSPMRYYRAGSAASALGPEVVDRLDLDSVSHVHLTGITAALSPSCLALVRALLGDPAVTTSFDVNWRPALWGPSGPEVLRSLAAEADIVLVGDDEAEALWGVSEPAAIRAVLPEPGTLVVKQGAVGATLVRAGEVFEPALAVDVVEPVGAGDAFAAGFLAAHLAGASPARCLRSGHLTAAGALCTLSDVAVPLPPADVARLLDADAATWAAARVSAAGVR